MFLKIRGRWLYPEPRYHLELEEKKALCRFGLIVHDFSSIQKWSPCSSSVETQMPASVREGNLFSLIRELFKCISIVFI